MNDFHSASGQPAYSYPAPVAPKKRNTAKIVLIVILSVLGLCAVGGVVALMGLGGAASQIDKSIKEDEATKTAAVTLVTGSCKAGKYGGYEAKVKIENKTVEPQSYWVQVDLMAADGKTRLGEGHAAVNDLKPGATTTVEASGNLDGDGKFQKNSKCVVGDVN